MALLTAISLILSPVYMEAQGTPPPAAPQGASTQGTQTQATPPQIEQALTNDQNANQPQTPPPPRTLNLSPDYSKGPHWFPNIIAPYTLMPVVQPVLTNSPRVDQLIQGGKLMLSLEDAISLGLENNLNIAVSRYTPWLDQASLLYAKSGANSRLPAGFAFDPTVTGTVSLAQTTTPANNPLLSGTGTTNGSGVPIRTNAPAVEGHTFTVNTQYGQGFATGTQLQVSFNNSRSSTSLTTNLFNPTLQSTLTAIVTQPLLSGFGKTVNDRYIIEGKNTVKVGESIFAQQVISTVTQVATDYWELVYARGNVIVQQTAVAADQQLYENNKKQLDIGTMAPLDVITAQSQLATDQQSLVQAQTTQLLDETTLLVAITKDPLAATLAGVEIIPTTAIFSPTLENIALEDAVKEAWQRRPEIQQAELNLQNAGIEIKATKNMLLPTLNLFGEFQSVGIDGTQKKSETTSSEIIAGAQIVNAAGAPVAGSFVPVTVTTTSPVIFPGGLGGDLSSLFGVNYPTILGGVNLTLPIRNRAAQSLNATAQLNQREQVVQYRQTQNTIVLNVRQTLITLEQDRAAVAAAGEARVLAQESYDDEVKKLQLGSSTAFTVTQKQQLLVSAEGTELRDRVNLIEAELNFNQAMGRTLDVHNITVTDAMNGNVSRQPNIPGTPDATSPTGHK
jgi:outer membrane protein